MTAVSRINLFTPVAQKFSQAKLRRRKVARICMYISVAMCVCTLALVVYQLRLQSQTNQVRAEQQKIQRNITAQLTKQIELGTIATRLDVMTQVTKNEVDYVKRRTELENLLSSTGGTIKIVNLTLSRDSAYTALLEFSTREDILAFLKTIEDDAFQKKIKLLSIAGVRVSRTDSSLDSEHRTLTIEGSFL